MKTHDMLRNSGVLVLSVFAVLAAVAAPAPSGVGPSTARYLDSSEGRDWPGYGRTFGEQHYSPLTQINRTNINQLGLVWWLELEPQNVMTQPIAVGGVLYFASGLSVVHAVDAVSGKILWRHDPKAAEKSGLNLRYYAGVRGIAWWNEKIYTGTHDGRLIALDAKTGSPVWSVQTLAKDAAGNITGAPRVFDGKVLIGQSSDTGKNRGYITAYDAETGKQLWRFHTVPGNPADGFENQAMEIAARTWAGEWWKFGGGGTVWNAMAYDPETDTVFFGTANGYPSNRRARSEDRGDNLFLASIVALQGKTGAYKWHYQQVPGETWEWDATSDIELADLTIGGKQRKVLMQASQNGFYYIIDRLTGELISAEPYAKVTWATRIDLKSGRPIETQGARYENGNKVLISPMPGVGSRNVSPMSYSPKQQLAYFSMWDGAGTITDRGIDLKSWQPPTDRTLLSPRALYAAQLEPEGATQARLIAWNPATQQVAWKRPMAVSTPVGSGVMATAGDLVFEGEVIESVTGPSDGTFNALDATTGKLLWSFAAQGPTLAPPVSYQANGKQYVSVLSGSGRQKRRMLTFALGGKASLPAGLLAPLPLIEDPEFKANATRAEAGAEVYGPYCSLCHSFSDLTKLPAPDLRRSAIPLSADAFAAIVRGGAFVPRGMPVFGEFSDEQLANLRQYLRTEAQKLREATGSRIQGSENR